ncbi:uncharacterized protein FTOL_08639 [Fusarium torulosum]|uniref:Uncharacterized protein n=1 Tax=Fusarium torulosum TaxID=33205 RepID=A0AAE8MEG6_9HYPO|nr:uncharacterized protein FTOL_08639 [Fusarium torulosum]
MRRGMLAGLKGGSTTLLKELEPAKLEAAEPTPADSMAPGEGDGKP